MCLNPLDYLPSPEFVDGIRLNIGPFSCCGLLLLDNKISKNPKSESCMVPGTAAFGQLPSFCSYPVNS